MNHTIYVTGHKHPDSDSICAAITYADLLNRTGYEAAACRQGPLNEETKFILKRFHQENPLLLTDARTLLKDISLDKPTIIRHDETVHHAWHVMLQTQNRSLFVVDDSNNLCGICTTTNLASVRLHPDADIATLVATSSLKNIARTIGGKIVYEPEKFHTNGTVHIITLAEDEVSAYSLKNGIAILSSGEEKAEMLVENGTKCLIFTCGRHASKEILNLAGKKDCAIVETDNDTMHTARVVTESYAVEQVMTEHVNVFHDSEYVSDVAIKMGGSRVRSYPVLDDDGNIVGAVSRYHTVSYSHRKFALVDHSAVNQSANNIEDADIVAIIDHHHIGGIQTDTPIEYRNHRCGSTCTIITGLYQEHDLLPDREMSGLLLSAILSDTLNLKSATTTDEDRNIAVWLAERAGIENIDAYAADMLGASVAISASTPHEILYRDLKTYEIGRYRFAIGQTNYSHMEEVQKVLPGFKKQLEKEQNEQKLDLMVMLFTNVLGEGSLFVYYGSLSYVFSGLIETKFDDHSGFDPNIISRKQQLMPKLSAILKNM
jgi:manganese-dependent inorganic pyrophosphatase